MSAGRRSALRPPLSTLLDRHGRPSQARETRKCLLHEMRADTDHGARSLWSRTYFPILGGQPPGVTSGGSGSRFNGFAHSYKKTMMPHDPALQEDALAKLALGRSIDAAHIGITADAGVVA